MIWKNLIPSKDILANDYDTLNDVFGVHKAVIGAPFSVFSMEEMHLQKKIIIQMIILHVMTTNMGR